MSPHTNFHAPGTSLSGRLQIGHKSGFIIYLFILFKCEYTLLREAVYNDEPRTNISDCTCTE
jgi:hypothetical protein